MKKWAVFSSNGGIMIDWDLHEKRLADDWMVRHKEAISNPDNYMHGAVLKIWEYESWDEKMIRLLRAALYDWDTTHTELPGPKWVREIRNVLDKRDG